jgi:ABC-type polysaccharide transport system permease subunit
MKKSFPYIAGVILFLALMFLPIVPQMIPLETFSPDGNAMITEQEWGSLWEAWQNWDDLNGSFHTEDTRRFNQIIIVVATVLSIATAAGLGRLIARSQSH